MSFLAVLLALLVEQLKPLRRDNFVYDMLMSWVAWTGDNLNAGRRHHAWVVWLVSVGVPTLAAAALHAWVSHVHVLLGLAFDVLLLYLTLGFRQFSHYFTSIREAVERGDEMEARKQLVSWRYLNVDDLARHELLRTVLEHSLLAAHRHVFGVFFWYVVLSAVGLGPAGAVLYRMSEFCARYWTFHQRKREDGALVRLMQLSQRAFASIDHVPARLTAFGFAVVGNFEEAINGWRRDAELWLNPNDGVLLASAAGALGVQLGGRAQDADTALERQSVLFEDQPMARGSTPGMQARVAHLQSVVGLVWRSVVLWMFLLLALTAANVLG